MTGEIRVHVVPYPDRDNLMLRYLDPVTRKQHAKSSGTTNRKEALKAAGKWEQELREKGNRQRPDRLTWEDFRERYEDEHLSGLAESTAERAATVFNKVERLLSPVLLRQIDASAISRLRAAMRKEGSPETTIASEIQQLRSALSWAYELDLLTSMPKKRRQKRGKKQRKMKGRPVRDDEFPLMLKAVAGRVTAGDEVQWERYLKGLFWGGLRLEEAINFWWDRTDRLCVDLSGDYPMIMIPEDQEKGNERRTLPMAPELAALILETPEAERFGPVFPIPRHRRKDQEVPSNTWVSRVVSTIGKAAGILVDVKSKKYASAHDLRRSFGTRWAAYLLPQELMQMMRHSSIEMTLRYYVDIEANRLAAKIHAVKEAVDLGNKMGNKELIAEIVRLKTMLAQQVKPTPP